MAIVIRDAPVPFFIRPITRGIAGKLTSQFLVPEFNLQYRFLENQLATSPNGGEYLCGTSLTAADIMMIFPLQAGRTRSGMSEEEFPRVFAYVDKLEQREAYKRAIAKIEAVEGSFKMTL